MNINDNSFSTILYTAVISFFGAICKEINDKSKDGTETFSIFFGEIILHGFSGWIVGLMANKYFGLTDLSSITIYAGIGGLFGYDLVKILLKIILTIVTNSKNVDINDITKDEDDQK